MKLILAKFERVLGLKGKIVFKENKPIMIYGENISGKSNIINLLRYCLIPSGKRGKKYSEEKRLNKNEILLEENTRGYVIIYFEQKTRLYKLEYNFSRVRRNVRESIRLYECEINDLERDEGSLERVNWIDLGVYNKSQLRKKFSELGVFPEILGTLISPSNVRNFLEAISGSLVTVPEVIAKEISAIHKNSEKYLKNLTKLNGVLEIETNEIQKKIRNLKEGFSKISKDIKDIDIEEVFRGDISSNLEELNRELDERVEKIPEDAIKIEKALTQVKSEKYRKWIKILNEANKVLATATNFKQCIKRMDELKCAKQRLHDWKIAFKGLPSLSKFHLITEFKIPDYEDFNFNILTYPEKIKVIFQSIEKSREHMEKAVNKSKEYDVALELEEINKKIKYYKTLQKLIKRPLIVKGDPAMIIEGKEKNIVSIPFDIVMKKPQYLLRNIESSPQIHKPRELDESEFKEQISEFSKLFQRNIRELRSIKKNLSTAKKELKKAKDHLTYIEKEMKIIEDKEKTNGEEYSKLKKLWETTYSRLCDNFDLEEKEINLSTENGVDEAFKILDNSRRKALKILREDLESVGKDYIKIPVKEVTLKTIEDIIKELEEKLEELKERKKKLRDLQEWITRNINEVRRIENREKAIKIIKEGIRVAYEIIIRIYELSDVDKLVEEIAADIESNVKEVYDNVFFEESFKFEHVGKGLFISKINEEPITHPSGSQKAIISLGIMLSLARLFDLPMILDEALDRIDVIRLKPFMGYLTGVSKSGRQVCIVAYKSFNIEKNPELLKLLKNWRINYVKRLGTLEKIIEQKDAESIITMEE